METQLEKGQQFWTVSNNGLPTNFITKKHYNGFNIFILLLAEWCEKKHSQYYITFKQAKKENLIVKKGAKGIPLAYYEKCAKNPETGKLIEYNTTLPTDWEIINVLKPFYVFSIADIELKEQLPMNTTNFIANNFLVHCEKMGVKVEFGKDKAYYSTTTDLIGLPFRKDFINENAYLATFFHELAHWAGHKNRLNRTKSNNKQEYAYEELIAELTAVYLYANLGVEFPLTENAIYLKSWLKALDDDDFFFSRAAKEAAYCFDFLMKDF